MDLSSLFSTLLANRGLTSTADISEFFHPTPPESIPLAQTGLSAVSVSHAIQLIEQHVTAGNYIAVYGDYDVDGICSTAILWENLHQLTSRVFPYIPHRREEGFGLSRIGIDSCLKQGAKLIITVDNGIVAHDQISYAKSQGAGVIIIDHHEAGEILPPADAVIHSTATCAAGLAWFFCRELMGSSPTEQLSLVSIAVVCDIVPLIGINRSLAKFGLNELKITHRPGLLALFALAKINPANLDTYHLGFIIGPRLNAMGRLEHALDSLRLVCTTDPARAAVLARTLDATNRSRQQLTETATAHAINQITALYPGELPKLLFVADPSYDQGVIGLIAAKLVEKYYRPAVAVSIGDPESKASARSVAGFHITDHFRSSSDLFTSVGGHAMAAGFTFPTKELDILRDQLVSAADKNLSDQLLIRTRRFDTEISLDLLDLNLYWKLQEFSPFGIGNPQPTFLTPAVPVSSQRRLGAAFQHLRFLAGPHTAIWFNAPQDISSPRLDIIYHLGVDTYHQPPSLQLVVKDSPRYVPSR